jgi:maltose-binding protein MalE
VRWLVLALLLLAGCESRERGIVLWHGYNGVEREALAAVTARWNAVHPERPIELVAVPYAAFADKLTSAIPNGNGPDLFIYSQDRIGDWAGAAVSGSGVIEPIEFWVDDALLDRFEPRAVSALAYRDSLWGLPLATKSLALFYRTDLVAAPPATTDELERLARPGRYAVAYANANLYSHAPWLFAHGGTLLDARGALAIATPEATRAAAYARHLVDAKLAASRIDAPEVAQLFNAGATATAISGPWFIAELAAETPWAVAPLPVVSATGRRATPFLGVDAVIMSARARDKSIAFEAMSFLTDDASAVERGRLARQVVPNLGAYADPALARDPVIAAFRAQLAHTVRMPVEPAMRMVWQPYKTALGEILAGGAEPGTRLLAVEREVQGYLDGAAPR